MRLGNKKISVVFDDRNGRIISLKDESGLEYISSWGNVPLVEMKIMDGRGYRQVINSDFNCSLDFGLRDNESIITFKNFGGFDIKLVVTVSLKDDGICFSCNFTNNTDYLVEWVWLPKILLENRLVSRNGTFKLFMPFLEGVEVSDYELRKKYFKYFDADYPTKGWEGVYPGPVGVQYAGYYDDNRGLYFGLHDDEFKIKQIDFDEKWNGIEPVFKVFTGSENTEFSYDFEIVIKPIQGGFYACAEEYRKFADEKLLANVPVADRNDNAPEWVEECPVVVMIPIRGEMDTGDLSPRCYYPYDKITKYIDSLAEKTESKILALLCHWEGTAPWCPPYVWPPYGDFGSFKKFVEELHAKGNLLGLYCSGIGWTETSMYTDYTKENTLTEAEKFATMCISPEQTLPHSIICNGYIRWGYDMCPACANTLKIMNDEVKKIVEGCDIDYLQLFDQNLGGNSSFCYSSSHGHPRIPGEWQIKAMRELIVSVQKTIKDCGKSVSLGTEASASEGFFDLLNFNDGRNFQGFTIGKPVPAYNYIYGRYTHNFMGNQITTYIYLDAEENPDNLFYRTAHLYAQGDLITLILKNDGKVNWDWGTPWFVVDPDQNGYLKFVKELNALRKDKLNAFMLKGRMERPLTISCGKYILKYKKGEKNVLPAIINTCFAYKDDTVQLLINPLSSNETVKIFGGDKRLTVFASTDSAFKDGELLNDIFDIPARSALAIKICD